MHHDTSCQVEGSTPFVAVSPYLSFRFQSRRLPAADDEVGSTTYFEIYISKATEKKDDSGLINIVISAIYLAISFKQ